MFAAELISEEGYHVLTLVGVVILLIFGGIGRFRG